MNVCAALFYVFYSFMISFIRIFDNIFVCVCVCVCNCRFLNNAEIAPHVSGANYTFFVPDDKAFEKLGFDKLSDDVMVRKHLKHFKF